MTLDSLKRTTKWARFSRSNTKTPRPSGNLSRPQRLIPPTLSPTTCSGKSTAGLATSKTLKRLGALLRGSRRSTLSKGRTDREQLQLASPAILAGQLHSRGQRDVAVIDSIDRRYAGGAPSLRAQSRRRC